MKRTELQWIFSRMVADLLDKAHELGYEVTLGDCYRDPRCPYGNSSSLHKKRLAIDLNLFKDGEYLRSGEDHRILGEWWKSIGGSWDVRDGNHYSLNDGTMVY